MALYSGLRKSMPPKRQRIRKCRRPDPVEHTIRNSYVNDVNCTTMKTSRKQEMSGLTPEKCNGEPCIDRAPHHLACGAVHTARQIYSRNGHAACVHQCDGLSGRTFNAPVKPRTEKCINNQITSRERPSRWLADRSVPALSCQCGVTLQPVALPDKANAHCPPALGQITRGNETIATIVARACHDHDTAPVQDPAGSIGNCAARILHQIDAGNATGNCQAVGLCHFGRREQFDHLPG